MSTVTIEELEIIVRAKVDEALRPLEEVLRKVREVSAQMAQPMQQMQAPLQQVAQSAKNAGETISRAMGGKRGEVASLTAQLENVNSMLQTQSKLYEELQKKSIAVSAQKGENSIPALRMDSQVQRSYETMQRMYDRVQSLQNSISQAQVPNANATNQGTAGVASAMQGTANAVGQNVEPAVRSATRAINRFGREAVTSTRQATGAFVKLGTVIKRALVVGVLYKGFRELFKFISDGIKNAIAAPEIENLFRVAMGNMADQASEFAEQLKDALGIDPYTTKQMLGTFQNMTTSMGVGTKTSYAMSKSLTMLAHDMASLYNVSSEQTFENLQSAISGMGRAVRKYGFVVTETTIKQTALKYGLISAGQTMSEQQKVIARYLTMYDQSTNAQGDMARTINSLQNQLRILGQNFKAAGRNLGEAFLPLLQEVVPWLNALAVVLQRAFNALARFSFGLFGKDYDTWKKQNQSALTGIGDISTGMDEAGDMAETAGKKAKNALAPFDELNVITKDSSNSSSGGNAGAGGGAVEFPMPEIGVDDGNDTYETFADTIVTVLKNIQTAISPTIDALVALWEATKPFRDNVGQGLKWLLDEVLIPIGKLVFDEVLPTFILTLSAAFEVLNGVIEIVKAIGVTGVITGIATALLTFSLTGNLPLALAIGALSGALAQIIENNTELKILPSVIGGITAALVAFKWGGFAAGSSGIVGLGAALILFAKLNDVGPGLELVIVALGGAIAGFGVAVKAGMDISTLSSALAGLQVVVPFVVAGIAAAIAIFVDFGKMSNECAVLLGIAAPIIIAALWGVRVAVFGATMGLSEVIAWVVAGISALVITVKALGASSLPEIEKFAKSVSEETKKIVEPLIDLADTASSEITKLFTQAEPLTLENTSKISGYFTQMANTVKTELENMKNAAVTNLAAIFGEDAVKYEDDLTAINQVYDEKISLLNKYDEELKKAVIEAGIQYDKESTDYATAVEAIKQEHKNKVESLGKSKEELEAGRKAEIESLNATVNEEVGAYVKSKEELTSSYDDKIRINEEKYNEINDVIKNKLMDGKRLTTDEYQELVRLQDGYLEDCTTSLAANATEAKTMAKTRKTDLTTIRAEEASEILKEAKKSKEDQISKAQETYDEALRIAKEKSTDVITEEDFLKTEVGTRATQMKQNQIDEATAGYEGVVAALKEGNPDVLKQIDANNGEIKTKFQSWWEEVAKGWSDFWSNLFGNKTVSVDVEQKSVNTQAKITTDANSKAIPKFAKGAVLRKPTVAQMAEYAGASSNPEIVAPQNILYETAVEANGVLAVAISEFASKIVDAIRENQPTVVVGDKTVFESSQRGNVENDRMVKVY